jgi:two-component system sensor histidine kinase/response regulator
MNPKAKFLIIDDEEVILESCTLILAHKDYQIMTASNGVSGLKLFEEFQPDVVFVDLKMPGISGFEVIEKIYELDPTVVTVVITGFATVSSAVEAMKKGAYDFLPKPFTPDELRLIAKRGLEKRRLILETIQLRREKEMLRDQFAAIVSHELKSPLGAVQQNMYVLAAELADRLTPEQKVRFERIQVRIGDMVNLITTWLRVLSVDFVKIQENFKPVVVMTAISKAVESIQPHAIRKDIDLNVAIQEPDLTIHGDEGTLVEAMVNIIGNAVKYSHSGSQVRIYAYPEHENCMITIVDTGAGISKEDLPYIFTDFYVGKSAPVEVRGSGIGLAVTKRIIEAHNGIITVNSELGKGSTFTLQIPMVQPSDDQQEKNKP